VPDLTVVVMTRDRVDELLPTLARLQGLPERPPIVVVDNGSTDGTATAVRDTYPDIEVVALGHNAGVEARNLAVRRAATPYVAFNDDDSWWAPGSLRRVVELFDAHPRLGAVAAEVRVEPGSRPDPVCAEMRDSPLPGDQGLPGIPVLGFLACAAAVRTAAFDEVGGFERRLHFGGEEELLCIDLATRGWGVQYVPELRVHHQPSARRDSTWRRRRGIRNALWTVWLRRPLPTAVRRSWRLLRKAEPAAAVGGLVDAVRGIGWVLRSRAVVPAPVEHRLRLLEPEQDRSRARQYAR
jgi:GT2 family glycosyltransferase